MKVRLPTWLLLFVAAACAQETTPRAASVAPDAGFRFAVVGDNRGDPSGLQPAVFREIVRAINQDQPILVFNTGDMIYGYTEDEAALREYWRGYRDVVEDLEAPLYHVPGNHDLFDAQSARVYRELWGPTYFSLDRGAARFIALDTETELNRIGEEQFRWLQSQLQGAENRHVFVFLHRPLFPVDGHTGNSLDMYPEERDRLHQMFVQHREAVRGVFLGHEHLFDLEELDGVPYYITGGGGANLYVPPELGGYHHYLLVSVEGEQVSVEVKKVGSLAEPPRTAREVQAGTLLEGWESNLLWYTWDHSVQRSVTREWASQGTRGLEVRFDFALVETPLLYAQLAPARDLSGVGALAVDLHAPSDLPGRLLVALVLNAGGEKFTSPATTLRPGWNRIEVLLDSAWLPSRSRDTVEQVEWIFSSDDRALRASVVFDDFRAIDRETVAGASPLPPSDGAGSLLEGWERDISWGAWDVPPPELSAPLATQGTTGLRVRLSFPEHPHPALYASLSPAWDLRRVGRLTTDVYLPEGPDRSISARFVIGRGYRDFAAPAVALRPGWNRVTADLDGGWLAEEARRGAEQLRLEFSSGVPQMEGWVVVDNLRSEVDR